MLVMIPFWTSFLIRTYAWISILSQEGLLNALLMTLNITSAPIGFMYTPFAVILGLVYNFLPFHDSPHLHQRGKARRFADRSRL